MSTQGNSEEAVAKIVDPVEYSNKLIERILDLFPDVDSTEFALLRGLQFELLNGNLFAVYESAEHNGREFFPIEHRRDLREFRRKYGLKAIKRSNTDKSRAA